MHSLRNFVAGTNFIIQSRIDGKAHFVGYGKVKKIDKKDDTIRTWNGTDIGVCFPSDQGIPKINKFQEFLNNHDNKLLWGVGWSINDDVQKNLPIKGYVYFRGKIIFAQQSLYW